GRVASLLGSKIEAFAGPSQAKQGARACTLVLSFYGLLRVRGYYRWRFAKQKEKRHANGRRARKDDSTDDERLAGRVPPRLGEPAAGLEWVPSAESAAPRDSSTRLAFCSSRHMDLMDV